MVRGVRINFRIELALKSPTSKDRTSQYSFESTFSRLQRRGGILAMKTMLCNTWFFFAFSVTSFCPHRWNLHRHLQSSPLWCHHFSPSESSAAMPLFIGIVRHRAPINCFLNVTQREQMNEDADLKGAWMKDQGAQQYTAGLDGP